VQHCNHSRLLQEGRHEHEHEKSPWLAWSPGGDRPGGGERRRSAGLNATAWTTTATQNPFLQARFAAITHLAMFEAVNSITGTISPTWARFPAGGRFRGGSPSPLLTAC
jgi:hypothetical protein